MLNIQCDVYSMTCLSKHMQTIQKCIKIQTSINTLLGEIIKTNDITLLFAYDLISVTVSECFMNLIN